MADLESSFRTLVVTDPALGITFSGRLHWNVTPDGTNYPYIRATTVTDKPLNYQNKRGSGRLGKATIQLDIWDNDKVGVNLAAEQLRTFLDGYRGPMGDYEVRMFVTDVPSSWEEEQRAFRRILEVEVGYAKS